MSYEVFFRNVTADDPDFFDEGPRQVNVKNTTAFTSSLDTSAIDAYRQGVELTRQRFFDAGTVKIHAGTPGGRMSVLAYGSGYKNFQRSSAFEELDYFNPVTFINSQNDLSSSATLKISYPIIVGDNDQLENTNFNGIIEPLDIRAVASFFSIEVPFIAHSIKGTLQAGNSDQHMSTDTIMQSISLTVNTASIIPYVDMVDMFNGQVPMNGYFQTDKVLLTPFEDVRYLRNAASQSYSADMQSALSPLTGSTDNFVGIDKKSASAGFVYGDASVTDSVAFGGMTY